MNENLKATIVGEMHNDLFYKCDAFQELEEKLAESIYTLRDKLQNNSQDEIKTLIHGIIQQLPKKIPGESFIKRGGNGNNSTELFGTLGVPVKLMTVVGKGSEWMIDEVKKMGVDTSTIYQVNATTPISTIIEDPVTTKIFVAPNLKANMNFSSIDIDASTFDESSLVFFTPLAEKFKPVLDILLSKRKDIFKVFTIESQAISELSLLKKIVTSKANMLFINKRDALGITNTENLASADEILQEFAEIRVITLGSDGTLIRSDFCEPVTAPIFDVPVVDRTGAGDAYAAGVLLRCHELIIKHGNLIETLKQADQAERMKLLKDIGLFGSVVASLKVSIARTPTKKEVNEFYKKYVK